MAPGGLLEALDVSPRKDDIQATLVLLHNVEDLGEPDEHRVKVCEKRKGKRQAVIEDSLARGW